MKINGGMPKKLNGNIANPSTKDRQVITNGQKRRKYGHQFYEEWHGAIDAASSSAAAAELTPEEIADWWKEYHNPKNWLKEWEWCDVAEQWYLTWWKYDKKSDKWRVYGPMERPQRLHVKQAPKSKWNPSLEKESAQAIKEHEIANMAMNQKPIEGYWLKEPDNRVGA